MEIFVKNIVIGYSLAVFTVMMWSMNLIYSKYLAGILTPAEISFYRWFIALFLMVPLSFKAVIRDRIKLLKHWKMILLMALSGLGVQNWLIYLAGYTATATNMSLISILGPVFLILMSRQKLNLWQIGGIVFAIAGVIVIILRGDFSNLADFKFVAGDIYMLGSAFLFAVYALIQRQAPDDVDPTALLTCGILTSAVIFFFPSLPYLNEAHVQNISTLVWVILLILGIVNSGLAYLSWDITIKKIGTVDAGTMYYTLPIFAISAAYVLLGEKVYEVQLWGAFLIIIGIFLVMRGEKRHLGDKSR